MTWIKCSDRLPEFNEEVLVYAKDDIFKAYKYYIYDYENECDSYNWFISHSGMPSFDKDEIEFWQPLTPPPTEE